MLSVPAVVATALDSGNFQFCLFYQIPGSSTHYLSDHWKDLTYNANTYLSQDALVLSSGDARRGLEITADSIVVRLSNADKTLYTEYASGNQVGKEVIISVAFVDQDGDLLAADSVVQMFGGLVDSWSQTDRETSSEFAIRLTNHWSAFDIRKGRFTNSASQEEVYPGDTFFEFSFQEELPTKWGI